MMSAGGSVHSQIHGPKCLVGVCRMPLVLVGAQQERAH